MEKWLYLLFLMLGFGLGYLVADYKQVIPPSTAPEITKTVKPDAATINHLQDVAILTSPGFTANTEHLNTLSEQQHQQIAKIIEMASEQQVGDYLKKAFPKQDFSMIQNKKTFAQRTLEELSSKNDEQALSGRLLLALTPVMPQLSEDLRQVHQFQEVFAHFDTMGQSPMDEQIFIRWLNRDTGEVLLFTPRRVTQNVTQNWVSTTPSNGWQAGTYDVKVYQMRDQLTPIAQASYQIVQVL
ncbi:hypothetical protein NDN13_13200 [Acinetobacter sp. C32I]|uniref:hypothetical protein n=1 Tax=Acinetobacter sp. C32I TaxID=2950074 RepID=UPI0020373770|nr:hypothetical protein [Acinetobacter sp. C32I]USA52421.1 hypothetical protein NDN13_13200 [Acinetobacter sp. C32I]